MLCKDVEEFLTQLAISWPSSVDAPSLEETVSSFKDFLRDFSQNTGDVDSTQGVIRVQLKNLAEKHNLCLQEYDPNLDFFLGKSASDHHIWISGW